MEISITITGDSSDNEIRDLIEFLYKPGPKSIADQCTISPDIAKVTSGTISVTMPTNYSIMNDMQIIKKRNKNEEDIAAFVNLLSPEKQRLYNILSPMGINERSIVLTSEVLDSSIDIKKLIYTTRNNVYQLAKSVFKGRKFRIIRFGADYTAIRTK